MKSLVLPPLASLYGAITRTRASLYERGTFRSHKLDPPVISVGNITAGGTGKTPLVEFVSRTLAEEGKRVCILTRGYGRENSDRRVLVSDGQTVFSNPAEAGDEPFLLANNLKGVAAVISDANRFAAGEGAIKHLGTNCFVLDDGFQHLQLARNLDIVTIDATNPWGGGKMLPFGLLREPLSGLKRADCFVITRSDQTVSVESIRRDLGELSGDRPTFNSRMVTRGIVPLFEATTPFTPSQKLAAFCAVGNPKSFFQHLEQSGFRSVIQQSYPDHYVYKQGDIDRLTKRASQGGASALITTAKDAVKLSSLNFTLPCYVLEAEIQIDDENEFRRLLLSATNIR